MTSIDKTSRPNPDWEKPEDKTSMAKLIAREYLHILDQDVDEVEMAFTCDAFSIKEYKEEWGKHIHDLADALYEEDALEIGNIMLKRAKHYLMARAEDRVREEL